MASSSTVTTETTPSTLERTNSLDLLMVDPPSKKARQKQSATLSALCTKYNTSLDRSNVMVCEGRKVVHVLKVGDITSPVCFLKEVPTPSYRAKSNKGDDDDNKKMEEPKWNSIMIPNGWKVAVIVDGEPWTAEVRIEQDKLEYRFVFVNEQGEEIFDKASDWCETPGAAFKSLFQKIHPDKDVGRHNGKLYIGCHYDHVQYILRDYFSKKIKLGSFEGREDILKIVKQWLNGEAPEGPARRPVRRMDLTAPSKRTRVSAGVGAASSSVTSISSASSSPAGTNQQMAMMSMDGSIPGSTPAINFEIIDQERSRVAGLLEAEWSNSMQHMGEFSATEQSDDDASILEEWFLFDPAIDALNASFELPRCRSTETTRGGVDAQPPLQNQPTRLPKETLEWLAPLQRETKTLLPGRRGLRLQDPRTAEQRKALDSVLTSLPLTPILFEDVAEFVREVGKQAKGMKVFSIDWVKSVFDAVETREVRGGKKFITMESFITFLSAVEELALAKRSAEALKVSDGPTTHLEIKSYPNPVVEYVDAQINGRLRNVWDRLSRAPQSFFLRIFTLLPPSKMVDHAWKELTQKNKQAFLARVSGI